MNRRHFLKKSAIGLCPKMFPILGSILKVSHSFANTKTPHFFLQLKVQGGMDVTLGLDPKTHHNGLTQKDIFLEYRAEDIYKSGGISLGPSALPLVKHVNDITIINGINMKRDADHISLTDYINSGNGNGNTATLPVEIGALNGTGPLGVLIDHSINSGSRNIVMSSTNDILNSQAGDMDAINLLSYYDFNNLEKSSLNKALQGLSKASKPLKSVMELLDQYKEDQGQIEIDKYLAAALSFSQGLSNQAVLQIMSSSGTLDTHTNHEEKHLLAQKEIWQKVSDIFDLFKSIEFEGKSLFDHTTFMVTTEFSRTPFLNNSKGKDHNPYTNSVLLAGKNISSHQTFGASHIIPGRGRLNSESLHFSTPMDFETGQLIKNESELTKSTGMIYPEHVASTIANIYGVSSNFSSVDTNIYKPIPGLFKESLRTM